MKHLLLILSLIPSVALASFPKAGESLPVLEINDKGLLEYQNEEFSYQNWRSDQLTGKVFVIQAMAGRTSAQDLNAPLIDAITEAQFPGETFQMVSVINSDDAIWGTSMFVKNAIEGSKKEHPYATFVVDDSSAINSGWSVAKESSAIIIVDQKNQVIYAKDGALTAGEIKQAIALINQTM